MNYVTIATDVSSDDKHKITTWACYIRYAGGVIKETGQFKEYHVKTSHAETYALINALTIAKKNVPNWSDSKVIIYNEIEYVIKPIVSKSGNVRLRDMYRTEQITNIALPILQSAREYEIRDIKAHFKNWKTSDNPAKYAINRWCDIHSRNLLREIRKQKFGK